MRSIFGEKEEQAPFCSFGEQTKRSKTSLAKKGTPKMRSIFGEKEEQAPFCSFGEQTKRKTRCFETTRSFCSFLDAKIEYRERRRYRGNKGF